MKKSFLCFFMALICVFSVALCSCSKTSGEPETTQNKEEVEFRSKVNEKLGFEYSFDTAKMKSVDDFASMIDKTNTYIPAFSSKEDIDEAYIEDFFIRYYSGVDPESCDVIENEEGEKTAVANRDTVISLLFLIFRIDSFDFPTKEENPGFYSDGSMVYIKTADPGDAVYCVSETKSENTENYIIMSRMRGEDGIESFRLNFAEDEFGYYISSIEN